MAALNSTVVLQPGNISAIVDHGSDQLGTIYAPPWVSTPDIRGTMDILQSCVLTLIACIYTALHLDIPSKTTWYRLLLEKSKWIMITLLAPEISLYTAASQLYYAWKLKSALRKIQEEKQSSTWRPDADFEINLKYAFFIIMGAVRFDVNDILSIPDLDESALSLFNDSDTHPHSVRPGPAAIISLANKGHWIRIRNQNIDDKSKASIAQKALVVIQVLWMVMQCVSRILFDLPLTLLEIHTMIHVACAILLYACWFKKPLDVQEAVIVRPNDSKAEIAIMLQKQFYSEMSLKLALFPAKQKHDQMPPLDVKGEPMKWIEPEPQKEMRIGDILPSGLALYREDIYQPFGNQSHYSIDSEPRYLRFSFPMTTEFLRRWDAILSTFPDEERDVLAERVEEIRIQKRTREEDNPDPRGGEKQALLLARLEDFNPKPMTDWERPFWEGRSIFTIEIPQSMQIRGHLNTVGPMIWFWEVPLLSVLAAVLSAIYGGIHLVAWNWTFPSYAEGIAWKLSCFLIAGTLPCYYTIVPIALVAIWSPLYRANLYNYPADLPGRLKYYARETAKYLCVYITGFILSVLAAGYVLSRGFIIAEAFASLRYCPIGAFVTIQWVELFPHF